MTLHISPDLDLPDQAVTETFAILAKRGTGKSNAAVVMAEEMYDNGLPWVAIDPKGDWWGVRAAGDGKAPGLAVLVFGGLHGDVPLEPTGGRLVADLIIDQRLTAVLDVSEMSKADQRRFLIDFADRLYRRNTEPLHVFCEEADEYIPQRVMGENAKLVGTFETLVKRGRFRGIGITLITQRSASLNKDVLTQVETLIPMRTPAPQDRKAILAWVDYHSAGADAVAELPGLADGEAWVFSPQWLKILVKIQFRRRRTFDSGATPKVGGKPRPPATLAEVDLAAIKEAMAETIEKAKADDPRELRAQIRRLEKQLAERPQPTVERVEVPILPESYLDKLQMFATELAEAINQGSAVVDELVEQVNSTRAILRANQPAAVAQRKERAHRSPSAPVAPAAPRLDIAGGVGKTERNVLTVLVQHGPLTHSQIALLAGYSVKASTIGVALGKLRKLDLVDSQGQPVSATEAGVAYLGGDVEPLPQGDALLEYWRNRFGATERNVLDALLQLWPGDGSQTVVAELTGYSPTASTIGVALGKLRKVRVVDRWRISDDFARAVDLS